MNDNVKLQERADIIFLGKLQKVIELLNDIDDMIDCNSENQSIACKYVSDYEHFIQNVSDVNLINTKIFLAEFKKYRLIRQGYNNINELSNAFNDMRTQLVFKATRKDISEEISKLWIRLNQPYNNRCITDDKVNELLNITIDKNTNNVKKSTKGRKPKLTKEELSKRLYEGMRVKDIALEFGLTQSSVSHLKRKYNLGVRKYDKK